MRSSVCTKNAKIGEIEKELQKQFKSSRRSSLKTMFRDIRRKATTLTVDKLVEDNKKRKSTEKIRQSSRQVPKTNSNNG